MNLEKDPNGDVMKRLSPSIRKYDDVFTYSGLSRQLCWIGQLIYFTAIANRNSAPGESGASKKVSGRLE
jgi:hypothetical protein